jgi:hypothetical protein
MRGITLDELAATTRIPRRSLERLESGAFDRKFDGFVRGFVRTVAVALGLDPGDTVNRMLSEPDAEAQGSARRSRLQLVLFSAAATLLLLLPVLWFLLIPRSSEPRPGAVAQGHSDSDLVYRRDPVRALAESVGALAASDSLPGQPADPTPSAPGP